MGEKYKDKDSNSEDIQNKMGLIKQRPCFLQMWTAGIIWEIHAGN